MHFRIQCPRCELKFGTDIPLPPQVKGGKERAKGMTTRERSQNAKKAWARKKAQQ